jgi:hypothetical protein
MQTQYDNLKVSSPAPGHYIIEGLPTGSTQTEEGRLVHPMSVHIPPSLPSGLLLEIVNDRGAVPEPVVEVEKVEAGVKGSDSKGAVDAIVDHLSVNGATRIRDLANAVGLDVDTIKALDGQGFELGNAGWVKLKEGGEA